MALQSLGIADLALVAGGQAYNNPAFGRCGPGTGMGVLGNVYTPECRAHDQAVKDNLQGGDTGFMAHLKALPRLPAAIGSWFSRQVG